MDKMSHRNLFKIFIQPKIENLNFLFLTCKQYKMERFFFTWENSSRPTHLIEHNLSAVGIFMYNDYKKWC